MPRTYFLGAVKPHVRTAAQEIGDKFDVATILGVGARASVSDHPKGLALDFMVGTDRAKGDAIVAYARANWKRLRIKYIIWWQQIDEGSGFQPMEDRGGNTANHKDHPHISFEADSGSDYAGNLTNTGGGASDSGGGSDTSSSLAPITSPATWIRILEFVAGVVILAAVAWSVMTNAAT